MCNMLISKHKDYSTELEFIVYNVVFSETGGKFTTDFVYQQLINHKIQTDKHKLELLFGKWADYGLIFEDVNEYVINSMIEI